MPLALPRFTELDPALSPSPSPVEQTLETVVWIASSVTSRLGVTPPLLLLSLLTLALIYNDRLVFTRPRRKELSRPKGLPLIGNTIDIIRLGTVQQFERFHENMRDSKVGFHVTFPVTKSMIMFYRPEYIEYIQKTNFENFVKGPAFRDRFKDLLGETGIFVSDGQSWKTQRKMASHIFSVYQFRTWVQRVVFGELDHVIPILDALSDSKAVAQGRNKVLLPDLFFRYTLASFGKMAFATDMKCLTSSPECLEEDVAFSVAFDFVQGVINKRFVTPWWKISERFSKEGKLNRRYVEEMRTFGLGIIDDRLSRRAAGLDKSDKDSKDGKDLLDLFMDLTTDREELLVVLLNFIIAGRDTTAQGLSWLFYELIRQPQHIGEIRREIESVLGNAQEVGEDGKVKKLAYEQVKELPYTLACYSEALRLHPPVAKNGKLVLKDDVIVPQGATAKDLPPIRVYAGEQLSWSDWVIARNPDVWGEDAAEFNPERFIEYDDKGVRGFKNHGQWKYHVFNGGPRLCLGMNLANFEALALLSAVVPRYDFEWASREEGQQADWPLQYLNSVTHPSQNYLVKVSRRAAA
ncbi:cytochrome P450 [Violaceomyces palustris]|uniref:Cytochrome P450 n=1 Tax=Violaceomyces palustris TaxID=1673888 RepID=A0ACD0NYD0_9BASI|nr:cytochrome P450 [Violaceomyces palustris]